MCFVGRYMQAEDDSSQVSLPVPPSAIEEVSNRLPSLPLCYYKCLNAVEYVIPPCASIAQWVHLAISIRTSHQREETERPKGLPFLSFHPTTASQLENEHMPTYVMIGSSLSSGIEGRYKNENFQSYHTRFGERRRKWEWWWMNATLGMEDW